MAALSAWRALGRAVSAELRRIWPARDAFRTPALAAKLAFSGPRVEIMEPRTLLSNNLPAGVYASFGAAWSYDQSAGSISLTSGTLTFDLNAAGSLNVTASGAGSNLVFNAATEFLNSLTLTDGATAQLSQSGTDTVSDTVSTTSGRTSGPYSFGAYAAPSLSDNGATPLSVVAGQSFTATVANFFDSAAANSNPAGLSATVTWGDGTESSGTIVPEGGGEYAVTGTHAYATAGSYTASVAIAGTAGDSLAASVTAAVSNAAPVLTPIADQDPAPGSPLTISVPFTDADPSATYTATVDWGDGNGPQPATVADGTVTATLPDVPSQPLNATVTLTDQYGGTTTVGVPIDDSPIVPVDPGSTPDDAFTPDTVAAPATCHVWTVSFGATNSARFHPIRQDGTNNVYGPAEWEDDNLDGTIQSQAGEHDYPICYTRSGPYGDVIPTAGANIVIPNSFYVTGHTYAIAAVNTPGDGSGAFIWGYAIANVVTTTYGPTLSAVVTCSGRIAPYVADSTLNLHWYVLDINSGTELSAGWTHNTIYITLNDPTTQWTYTPAVAGTPSHPADPIAQPLETVLYLACAYAQGATAPAQVINKAWSNFENSVTTGVKDAHGTSMVYWGATASGTVDLDAFHTTTALLTNHDGRCEAWAALFADVLRAQGIAASQYTIAPVTAGNPDTPPSEPGVSYTLVGLEMKNHKHYNYESNLQGQGNSTPPAGFDDHVIVELEPGGNASDGIYDPSYGYYAPNLAAWANHSLHSMLWSPGDASPARAQGANDVHLRPYP